MSRTRLLPIACRFAELGCPDPAVVYVALDEGCVCFPGDRREYLCGQHLQEVEPLGDVKVLWDL